MSAVHIHAPQAEAVDAGRWDCPSSRCAHRTRRSLHVAWFTPWYGWSTTCLTCGDKWEDGEMIARPFAPKWWEDNARRARRSYRRIRDRLAKDPTP